MTDITDRLRDPSTVRSWAEADAQRLEAADEIDRLRTAVQLQVHNIERWMQTGIAAGPEEPRAIYEALRDALGEQP